MSYDKKHDIIILSFHAFGYSVHTWY